MEQGRKMNLTSTRILLLLPKLHGLTYSMPAAPRKNVGRTQKIFEEHGKKPVEHEVARQNDRIGKTNQVMERQIIGTLPISMRSWTPPRSSIPLPSFLAWTPPREMDGASSSRFLGHLGFPPKAIASNSAAAAGSPKP
ncbi:hypothetical protein SEVIR_6G147501v4 [Setaria viridis]